MAMGTRRHRQRQEELWYRGDLAEAPGHPFYRRLNEVFDHAGFDEFCEARCRRFYHQKLGRPSLAPGMYFRVMLIGFFEGIESERGIAWRVADSLCLRQFLEIGLDEPSPDHVTISRTRRLMDEATHQEVFGWVLRLVAQAGLLKGKTIGIDATTLEANAAMKSIVRRDTQESYTDYLKRLAEAEGLEATDEAALRRMDRRRSKKGANADWINPNDPEAQITRMKDGRTALAYKAEHAADMDTGAIVAVTVHGGAAGDTKSVSETLPAFAHAYATGALRRLYVRGKENVHKRLLLQAAACNLALLLRKMVGVGTPRAMQDAVAHLLLVLLQRISAMDAVNKPARSLPAVISRRMPHRHRCAQQEPAGEKSTL